jgi:hypothetical protein
LEEEVIGVRDGESTDGAKVLGAVSACQNFQNTPAHWSPVWEAEAFEEWEKRKGLGKTCMYVRGRGCLLV